MTAPDAPGLRIEREGAVLTITFDRPAQRNSFTPAIISRVRDALLDAARQPGLRVLVLRGAGGQAFSAGYDIAALDELMSSGILPLEPADPYEQANQALLNHPLPTVAMLAGWVMGGGCALAMGCDIRIAGEGARFGMPTAKLGVLYGHRDLAPFIEAIGPAWTRYLFMSGRVIDAATALRIGLVHEVVPDSELESATAKLVTELATNAPLSVQGVKRVIRMLHPQPDPRTQAEIDGLMRAAQSSADLQEGRRAFLEKRPPKFTGS